MYFVFLSIVVFLLTLYLLKLITNKIPHLFIDVPDFRSSHVIPKPTSGGLAFIFSTLLCIYLYSFFSNQPFFTPFSIGFLISLPLAIIGFLDDLFEVPQFYRFLLQLITSLIIVLNSNLSIPDYVILPLLILFIGFINLINFMDGIDGLIGGSFIIIFLTLFFYLNYEKTLLFLVFSLIAFIFINWYPSKIFMGDIGSTFLAAITLNILFFNGDFPETLFSMTVLTPLIADSATCLARRIYFGLNPFKPHKMHLYQRLTQAGMSHSKVSFIYILSSVFISISLFIFGFWVSLLVSILCVCFGFYLDQNIAISFNKSL